MSAVAQHNSQEKPLLANPFVKNCFDSVSKQSSKSARKTSSARSDSFSLDTVAQSDISDVSPDVFSRYLVKQLRRSKRLAERRELKKLFEKKLR